MKVFAAYFCVSSQYLYIAYTHTHTNTHIICVCKYKLQQCVYVCRVNVYIPLHWLGPLVAPPFPKGELDFSISVALPALLVILFMQTSHCCGDFFYISFLILHPSHDKLKLQAGILRIRLVAGKLHADILRIRLVGASLSLSLSCLLFYGRLVLVAAALGLASLIAAQPQRRES